MKAVWGLGAVMLLAFAIGGARALSPPWWSAAKTIQAALATDKYVTTSVREASDKLTLTINVAPCCASRRRSLQAATPCISDCRDASIKARALFTLLRDALARDDSGVAGKLAIRVRQNGTQVLPAPYSSPASFAGAIKIAMLGNKYFKEVVKQEYVSGANTYFRYLLVFQPKVAQVYVDDISQQGGLQTFTVTELMTAAFALDSAYVGVILPTTAPCDGTACLVTS